MRTTLTIDDDIAATLKRLARERDESFKETVNAALRAGLSVQHGSTSTYETPTFELGVRPDVDLTKALAIAAALDDVETVRELEVGK